MRARIIAAALLGVAGLARPAFGDLQAEQQAALQALNAQRQPMGLAPLTGDPQQDLPTLSGECQRGVVDSCRLAINLERASSGLPPLAFLNPAQDAPELAVECQSGRTSSCGLLQLLQQQTGPQNVSPGMPTAGMPPMPMPTPPATGGQVPGPSSPLPDPTKEMFDRVMQESRAFIEREKREGPIRRRREAELTRKYTEACNGGDREGCTKLRALQRKQHEAKMRAMDANIRALDFQQHVSESIHASEQRVENWNDAARAGISADEDRNLADYWRRQGDEQRAEVLEEKAAEEDQQAADLRQQAQE